MAIEVGLLLLSAIVGSMIGVGMLILSIYIWYWLSVAKSKVFTLEKVSSSEAAQEVKSTLLPYKDTQMEARRFSIPDPSSTSFDMGPRDMLLPPTADQVSITVHHNTESPARSQHTNDSLAHDPEDAVVVHDVIKTFVPKRKDDLALHVGDQVTVSMV